MNDDFSKQSIYNKESLQSGEFSCYHCRRYGKVSEINTWVDSGKTAICPMCGIDSVVSGKLSEDKLHEGYIKWFGDDDGH